MKKYIVEVSETAELDLENIISYLRNNLAEDINTCSVLQTQKVEKVVVQLRRHVCTKWMHIIQQHIQNQQDIITLIKISISLRQTVVEIKKDSI